MPIFIEAQLCVISRRMSADIFLGNGDLGHVECDIAAMSDDSDEPLIRRTSDLLEPDSKFVTKQNQ